MSSQSRNILGFINSYIRMKNKADRIKNDEEKREVSTYFGITSMVTSILGAAFSIFGAWVFDHFMGSGLEIFTIIVGIGLVLCGVILFVWALIRMLFQFRINKNWSAWTSLIIFIVGLIASGILVVMMMNK